MFKKILLLFINGISFGCLIFTVICIAFAAGGDGFSMIAENYIRMAVCSMIVGAGFIVPTLAYSLDALPYGLRVLIHMGTGMVVYFICALYAGWVPTGLGTGAVVGYIVLMLAAAWIIWLCFYLYNRHMVKLLNNQIKKKQN